MARLLHLTDLHFGFHRDEMVEPLLARIAALSPDLVVVGGDLTHRALPEQMQRGAAFLGRIAAPVLAVPGNHDVPAWNPVARLFWPFAGWRAHVAGDLRPSARAPGLRVLTLNSTDPYAWQRGKVREGEIRRLAGALDPLATNVVALHHPLQHLPRVDKRLARRADEALDRLEAAGIHIVLSGHLHRWAVDDLLATGRHPRLLQIQTGTALCARISDLQNEFVLLEIDGSELALQRHVAPMPLGEWRLQETRHYSRASGVWRRV